APFILSSSPSKRIRSPAERAWSTSVLMFVSPPIRPPLPRRRPRIPRRCLPPFRHFRHCRHFVFDPPRILAQTVNMPSAISPHPPFLLAADALFCPLRGPPFPAASGLESIQLV